jgi:hypothetical protein
MSDTTIYSRSSSKSSSRRKKRPTTASNKSSTDVAVLDKVVVYISQDGNSAAVGCNCNDDDCNID